MPTAINTLVSNVTALLQDAGNVRWGSADIINWLNDGQLAVVRKIPAAYPITTNITCVAGTQQSIPSGGLSLIRVMNNLSASDVVGVAPRRVSMDLLDTENPNWHADTAKTVTKMWMFNEEDPKKFYISPPQPSANQGKLRIIYSAEPSPATAGGNMSIDKIYDNALIEYALYRAFDRDSEDGDDMRAAKHLAAFEAALA